MRLTPVVFFELAMSDVDLPCFDPFFLAVRISKRLLDKLQAVESLRRKHGLTLAVFEASSDQAELPGTLIDVHSVELQVAGGLVWFKVLGRQYDEHGQLGKISPIAESWGIDLETLASIYAARTAVTLHTWPEWVDPDIDLDPFGPRVLAVLRETDSFVRYQRLEWFDSEWERMMAELSEPPPSRAERRRRQLMR